MATLQAPAPKRFRPDEYYRMGELGLLDERCELIDGEIFDMPPICPEHSTVSTILRRIIEAQLPAGFHVREGQPLNLGESQPQPDLAVVAGSTSDFRHSHPTGAMLVVEVADTSLSFDQSVKSPLYAGAGIQEYWVVDLKAKRLIVHGSPSDDAYGDIQSHSSPESLTPRGLPSVTVKLADII